MIVYYTTLTKHLFDNESVEASHEIESEEWDIKDTRGLFSLQYYVAGDGTLQLAYKLSNDGTNYVYPTTAASIETGIVKTSGIDSDGRDLIIFSPEFSRYIKIVAEETGLSSNCTIDLWVATQ